MDSNIFRRKRLMIFASSARSWLNLNPEDPEIPDDPPVPEPFSITINSGPDSKFILPTTGNLNNANNTYSWRVDWGDGSVTEEAGVGNRTAGSGIEHIYADANTNYTIKIEPQDKEELGWLRAFGFNTTSRGSGLASNKAKMVSVDGQLTEQMIRVNDTDTYVCSYMFYGCSGSSFTIGDNFQLPQGITTAGTNFCSYMFHGCSGEAFTIGVSHFFGSLVLPQAELNKYGVFQRVFFGCDKLIEAVNPANTPQLTILPESNNLAFTGCSDTFLETIPVNWGGTLE